MVDIQGKPQVAFDTSAAILSKDPKKVDAFVCLEAIAGKEVAEVVNRAKMSDKIIVAMDADPGTLEWVQKGVIAATVVQKPYTMAFTGLRMLDDLHHHPLTRLGANWAEDPFAHIPRSLDTGVTIDRQGFRRFVHEGSRRCDGGQDLRPGSVVEVLSLSEGKPGDPYARGSNNAMP